MLWQGHRRISELGRWGGRPRNVELRKCQERSGKRLVERPSTWISESGGDETLSSKTGGERVRERRILRAPNAVVD